MSIDNHSAGETLEVDSSRAERPAPINSTSIRRPDLPSHPFRRPETIQSRDLTGHVLVFPLRRLRGIGLLVVGHMGDVD